MNDSFEQNQIETRQNETASANREYEATITLAQGKYMAGINFPIKNIKSMVLMLHTRSPKISQANIFFRTCADADVFFPGNDIIID